MMFVLCVCGGTVLTYFDRLQELGEVVDASGGVDEYLGDPLVLDARPLAA